MGLAASTPDEVFACTPPRYQPDVPVPPAVAGWLGAAATGQHRGALVVVGSPGTGKTHLAYQLAREWVALIPQRVRLVRAADLAAALRPNSDMVEDAVRRYSTCPLLILDDVGVARMTPWQQEHLDRIVDERWTFERPTVVVSNEPDLRTLLGDRAADRLADGATVVDWLAGPSRRRQGGAA